MSLYPEIRVINSDNIPKLAIGILAVIAIFSIYIVGYDQGQLLVWYKEAKLLTQCGFMNLLMI